MARRASLYPEGQKGGEVTDGKKPEQLNDAQRIAKLERDLADAWNQIKWMQTRGGFTDGKTLSTRCFRIEERLEKTEGGVDALLDVAACHVTLLEDHLKDRHDADLNHDNSIDVVYFRKIRKRLHVWAEKTGLLNKRRDVRDARYDENRRTPRPVAAT